MQAKLKSQPAIELPLKMQATARAKRWPHEREQVACKQVFEATRVHMLAEKRLCSATSRHKARYRTYSYTMKACKISLKTTTCCSLLILFTSSLLSLLLLLSSAPVTTSLAHVQNYTLNLETVRRSAGNDHRSSSQHGQKLPLLPANFVKLLPSNTSSISRLNYGQQLARFDNQTNSDLSTVNFDVLQQGQKKPLFEKTCIGTSNRMSAQIQNIDQYQILAERYRGCTNVIGNLEITWLGKDRDNRSLDLSFLESIREISGYLLIAYVDVEQIRMPNLQIIRGREVFKLKDRSEEFAVFVMENNIRSLELANLREILYGDVGLYNNKNLCHMQSIEWPEILSANFSVRYIVDATIPAPDCPVCHESCERQSCWGPGPDMCQKFSKMNCAPQCAKGRCFGPESRECCHLFCAGGCTGPRQTECLACQRFNNDGECVQDCPPMKIYNENKFEWETNPNGKYNLGSTCVKECPGHLLRDNGACVRSCPPDKRSQDGECVSCAGPCPKNCLGVDTVNSDNIAKLVNCSEIEGSISILDSSFNGYSEYHANQSLGKMHEPMHPSKLKVLETVRSITGFLLIQANHPDFRNLTFLSNLESIGGRQQTDLLHSLSIIKTSLVTLNLRSLKRIGAGKVVIQENANLSFAEPAQFIRMGVPRDHIYIKDNGRTSMNLRCHEQCSRGGCWGPGPDECLSCSNYKLDNYCVSNCSSTDLIGRPSYDFGNRICKACDAECKGGCSGTINGTSAKDCWQCKNFKDGPYCVSECPRHKYINNGLCEECSKMCTDGCTGPSNKLGPGGCNSCGKIVIDSVDPVLVAHCIKADDACPEGYYQEYGAPVSSGHPLKLLEKKPVCRKCHKRCKSCTGYGTHKDVCECAGYLTNDQCEDSCHGDFFADEKLRKCSRCSRECNGCFGPTEADCLKCRVFRVYYDSNSPVAEARVSDVYPPQGFKQQRRFNCTAQCPPDKPVMKVHTNNTEDPYCSESDSGNDDPRSVPIGSTSFFFLGIVSVAIMFCVSVYKCQNEKDKTVKMTMRLSGFDDDEPLERSHLEPNLANLKSIKETELRKGNVLGSGFGGTVYQGLWYPEGQEKGEPRPVAIKVLRDNGQFNNNNFLDEAYIMTSAKHKYLVKLLAICMTPNQFMLVTELMPLGCLLDYVKNNRHEIGIKNLLEWGKQIAEGMAYLEDKRMVHRDLALRNVLVQTANRVRISDFGLAKFLDVDQSEYHISGASTRLPIKWLAPECIRERKFTHKSDVWAFGVTIWELLTFGQRPFEEYDTKDVPLAIEKGARLQQPPNVSAEVYKVMYACWFYNPDDRPDFKSLSKNFVNFARDPERYLSGATMLGRGWVATENEEDEFDSESTSQEEASPTQVSSQGVTTPRNRWDEAFGFDFRLHPSESETPNDHLSTPITKSIGMFNCSQSQQQIGEDAFSRNVQPISSKSSTIIDSNNNFGSACNNNRFVGDSCWSVHHTVSTNSIGQRSEQPTDNDDYLMPSPCSNDAIFSKFLADPKFNRFDQSSKATAIPQSGDPPHSAGLIGIQNEEYFMTRRNYVNAGGPNSSVNASSGHIPSSLV